MKNRSVMSHRFSEVPGCSLPRSTFDRSHGYTTTFDGGDLVPFLVDEIYPGDTVKCSCAGFCRLSTPTHPIFDNMYLDTFFFFVPNRLVWSNWHRFMGERDPDPDSSIDYTVPIVDDVNNAANESLYDYMGIPTKVAADLEVIVFPLRGYERIWNYWFRDQNLQDSLSTSQGDGPDSMNQYALQKRGKRHDYFTSCLPDTQKGDAVQLALGTEAPIFGDNMVFDGNEDANDNFAQVRDAPGASANLRALSKTAGTGEYIFGMDSYAGTGELKADLSEAIGPTVNSFRQAVQIQRLLERDMRSGTRYTEILSAHFGVTSDDARLQMPEYLGGGSTRINVTPVARTDSSPGALGAIGTGGFNGHGFVKSFVEHGFVIGIVNVRADLRYQEGLDRFWSRQTRYDYYWPVLSSLGEMAVLNKEIYVDATDLGDGTSEEVFGYQEAWADLRYKNSRVTGKMRSNDAASLDAWHLAIEFGDTPTLDDTFIEDNPPIDRVVVTPSEPHFKFDAYFRYFHTRAMPTYSVPGLVDHF